MIKKILFLLFVCDFACAGVVESFNQLSKPPYSTKGPFGNNVLQGSKNSVALDDPKLSPPPGFQFQAAFRNDAARSLATQYNF